MAGTRQFYRRNLPESCIDFASNEGKRLFSGALKSGFMNMYFKLASQFRTQEEPAFCGISTLGSVTRFRDQVKECVESEDTVLVASYNRKILGQTGSGHFSPIGGYESESDRVLIMDVARFKYPPHWVHLPLLYKAMTDLDTETKRPRGYSMMRLASCLRPLALFRLNLQIHPSLTQTERLNSWRQWLANDSRSDFHNKTSIFTAGIERFVQIFCDVPLCCEKKSDDACCGATNEQKGMQRKLRFQSLSGKTISGIFFSTKLQRYCCSNVSCITPWGYGNKPNWAELLNTRRDNAHGGLCKKQRR